MSKRKTYTDEFKTMIAELVLSGKPVKEVADEYSLSQSTIRGWVNKKAPIEVEGNTTNLEEILKIKKENARLKEENEIFKKSYGYIRHQVNPDNIYEIIKDNSDTHSIDTMCKVLDYPRSTYYDKQKEKPENKWKKVNKKLQEDILEIYNESNKVYGAPKIREKLKEKGYKNISIKRVQRHMKKLGIRSIVVKKYRPNSTKKVYEEGENLLNRDFSTTKINEKWVADITYIHTQKDGWTYLASILDLHTQKIVGYSFSKTMDTSLVLRALDNAITTQRPSKGLIIHSDRGSQYTSKEYRKAVETKEFRLSYSAKGCPYDNACIESFHAVLKKECVYLNTFIDYNHARFVLFQYIEGFYNRKRIHSSINYMTPDAYENLCRAS
ncbi:IS3 family transposase [Keratinibaculum paraultunense]|nr:IS3 family transposase [Keratinibaculum paraultunense]QQY79457.1 IS3 family transposase [Keratinibaculum paraultunense]